MIPPLPARYVRRRTPVTAWSVSPMRWRSGSGSPSRRSGRRCPHCATSSASAGPSADSTSRRWRPARSWPGSSPSGSSADGAGRRVFWSGGAGVGVGSLLIGIGWHPAVTLSGAVVVGSFGAAMLAVSSASLSILPSADRRIALTELNTVVQRRERPAGRRHRCAARRRSRVASGLHRPARDLGGRRPTASRRDVPRHRRCADRGAGRPTSAVSTAATGRRSSRRWQRSGRSALGARAISSMSRARRKQRPRC